MRNLEQQREDLADWSEYVSAPAEETGAFQNGFGAVGEGSVTVQKSARRQKVDTEALGGMEKTLLGAAAGYAGLQVRLAAVQAEAAGWTPMSAHARRAETMMLGAQADLADLAVALGQYAAKLETARQSYEHAEQVAATLVAGFDSLHSAGFRLGYTSAFAGAAMGGPVGGLLGLGVGLAPEGGLFLADAKLRGTGAATASALRGTGLPLENMRQGLVAAKRAERAAGFGLVQLDGFHEVESKASRLGRDGNLEFVARKLNEAGTQDDVYDARQGLPQHEVETAHVDVTVVTRPDGTRAFLVSVPGTDFDNKDATSDPDSLATIFDAASTTGGTPLAKSPAMMQAVDRALAEAGADGESDVVLSGFSQGGMQAMALASNREFTGKYRVRAVATTGTPTNTYEGVDPDIKLLHLRDVNDPVPRSTGGGTKPGNDQAIVVHSNTGDPGSVVSMTHDGEKYRGAARTADAELGKSAEGREYLDELKRVMPAGSIAVTHTYETKQRTVNDPNAPGPKTAAALADAARRASRAKSTPVRVPGGPR